MAAWLIDPAATTLPYRQLNELAFAQAKCAEATRGRPVSNLKLEVIALAHAETVSHAGIDVKFG